MKLSFLSSLSAGFPSPAVGWQVCWLDVRDLLIPDPTTTYFARVSGMDGMWALENPHINMHYVDYKCFLSGEFLEDSASIPQQRRSFLKRFRDIAVLARFTSVMEVYCIDEA